MNNLTNQEKGRLKRMDQEIRHYLRIIIEMMIEDNNVKLSKLDDFYNRVWQNDSEQPNTVGINKFRKSNTTPLEIEEQRRCFQVVQDLSHWHFQLLLRFITGVETLRIK